MGVHPAGPRGDAGAGAPQEVRVEAETRRELRAGGGGREIRGGGGGLMRVRHDIITSLCNKILNLKTIDQHLNTDFCHGMKKINFLYSNGHTFSP